METSGNLNRLPTVSPTVKLIPTSPAARAHPRTGSVAPVPRPEGVKETRSASLGRRDLNPLTRVSRYAQLSQAIDSMRQSIAAIAGYRTVFRWHVSRMLAPRRPIGRETARVHLRIGAPAWPEAVLKATQRSGS